MTQTSLTSFSTDDDPLTERQRTVWAVYHATGGVRPAARELDVNPGTVHQHIKRAERKLGEGSA